jgi:hypothetical protein
MSQLTHIKALNLAHYTVKDVQTTLIEAKPGDSISKEINNSLVKLLRYVSQVEGDQVDLVVIDINPINSLQVLIIFGHGKKITP